MTSYTIICDPSENPDDVKNLMNNNNILKCVKRVRLWSFLKYITELRDPKLSKKINKTEKSISIFYLESDLTIQKRKITLENLMSLNLNANNYFERKINFDVETLNVLRRRKSIQNCTKTIQISNGFNFKPIRELIGYQKLRRNPFINSTNLNKFDIEKIKLKVKSVHVTDQVKINLKRKFDGTIIKPNISSSRDTLKLSPTNTAELNPASVNTTVLPNVVLINTASRNTAEVTRAAPKAAPSHVAPTNIITAPPIATYSPNVTHLASGSDVKYEIPYNLMEDICKYHVNMVRPYPKTERTEIEQARRDRNTKACRVNRRASKLEEILLKAQYNDMIDEYRDNMRAICRSVRYIKALTCLADNVGIN